MIDKATVSLILDTADIVDVVSDFVTLKKKGANYWGLCPFHNDRTPSFAVSKTKGICKCFSCGESASAVGFIMKLEQMSYTDALKYLANKYHIEVKERELTDKEKEHEKHRDSMLMLNEWTCKYFEETLHDTTEGQEVGLSYFNERGFSTQTIKKFRLGYALEDRSALYKAATKAGFNRELLFETGLCIDNNRGGGYDRYAGRVIFPIFNVAGKIVAFGGRTLKKDKSVAKYVNSPESIIYSKRRELYGLSQAKREIAKKDMCYIVEGYADVISMHQSGFENVIASSGTALTDEHIHKIHRFTENVTEMFDGDEAGIKAAMKGIDKILSQGLNMKVLLLPDDDDPDSYSRKHSASEIQRYIDENEEDFISFKTRIMLKDCGRDPIKRSQAIDEVTKSIAVIPSEITRNIYAKECSNMFGISEDVILRAVKKHIENNKEEDYKKRGREKPRTQGPVQGNGNDGGDAPTTPNVNGGSVPVTPVTPVYTNPPKVEVNPFERDLMKLLVKYGMCAFTTVYDNETQQSQEYNVLEYISGELFCDNMSFTTPVYKMIFDISMDMLDNFYNDLSVHINKVAAEGNARATQLIAAINPVGHGPDSLKQEEDRIYNAIESENAKKVLEYRTLYLEKLLCSHPDDEVRDTATDLVSEKYTLSRIHTEHATIPSEYDKLKTLVPGAIYNWKLSIVNERIKNSQAAMANASPDLQKALMTELKNLYLMRSQLAKLTGERVVNAK